MQRNSYLPFLEMVSVKVAVCPCFRIGVAFPVLIYEFLVGVWMIRLAQSSGAGFRA